MVYYSLGQGSVGRSYPNKCPTTLTLFLIVSYALEICIYMACILFLTGITGCSFDCWLGKFVKFAFVYILLSWSVVTVTLHKSRLQLENVDISCKLRTFLLWYSNLWWWLAYYLFPKVGSFGLANPWMHCTTLNCT